MGAERSDDRTPEARQEEPPADPALPAERKRKRPAARPARPRAAQPRQQPPHYDTLAGTGMEQDPLR